MFVADRLVYLELQKTGCTQVARLLAKTIPGKHIGKHIRLEQATDKTVCISVRNPWDWYVSLWAYGCMQQGYTYGQLVAAKSPFAKIARGWWREVAGTRRAGLATARAWAQVRKPVGTWRETYRDADDADSFRRWLRLILAVPRRFDVGEGYGESSVSRHAGLLTFRYLNLCADEIGPVLSATAFGSYGDLEAFDRDHNITSARIRTDKLEDDLIETLRAAGYEVGATQIELIRSAAATRSNASRHGPTAGYYDERCIELVRRRERLLVEKYGFEVPLDQSSRREL